MNRADAYAILARELEVWRAMPYETLVNRVEGPASCATVRVGDEEIVLTVQVVWEHRSSGGLRIVATADGPSCWRLERLEESIVIFPPERAGR